VVLADVAGSLAMAGRSTRGRARADGGLLRARAEAVHAERGTVNQFRGDGFMALFGAPRAHGDDAARALRAALEVRERSNAYAESVRARYGVPFAVRIGVSTGLVWVGAIGNELRRDYTAEGPTVIAARLEPPRLPGDPGGRDDRPAGGRRLRSRGPGPRSLARRACAVFERWATCVAAAPALEGKRPRALRWPRIELARLAAPAPPGLRSASRGELES
jgi:hypothetical protein